MKLSPHLNQTTYSVVRNLFPAFTTVIQTGITTKEEAEKIASRYKGGDAYESIEVIKEEQT